MQQLDGVDLERLDAVCRQYEIASLSVFGSVARDAAQAGSDIDLLYELRAGGRLGWEIEDLSDELAEILGRPVDLVAKASLHPMLTSPVLSEARELYAS